jgi:hypothetical protein
MRDTIIAAAGRSGLIARRRLIEAMPYFLQADAGWTMQHLISVPLAPDASELSLWRALAWRMQRSNALKIIGDAVVARAADLRLGRETRRSLIFSLIVECLHALHEDRAPAVPYSTIQQMIRSLDDVARADAAGVVQQFVRELSAPRQAGGTCETPEYLFFHVAAPFLRDVWPQERSLSQRQVLAKPWLICRRPPVARLWRR